MVKIVLNGVMENGKWSNIVDIWRNDYKLTAHQVTRIVIMLCDAIFERTDTLTGK